MAYLTWQRLTLVAGSALVLAWLVTRIMVDSGGTPAAVPWTVLVFCGVASALTLGYGWQVLRYRRGRRPSLDGLRAARTAVFAQACAYVGAVLGGAYGGYALGLLDQWGHGPRRDVIVTALLAAVGGATLLAAGALAERWCRHADDDDEQGGTPSPA